MKIEPIKQKQVDALIKVVKPLAAGIGGLLDVDISQGRGVLDDTNRKHCLWTKDGHRVTIDVDSYNSVIVSKSKDVDPEWKKRRRGKRVKNEKQ